MTDELIFIAIILLGVLTWYFAIRKTIYHYQLLKNSNYGLLVKFFVLGNPFFFILPSNTVNESNNDLYKKGMRYYILFFIAFVFSYLSSFIWMSKP